MFTVSKKWFLLANIRVDGNSDMGEAVKNPEKYSDVINGQTLAPPNTGLVEFDPMYASSTETCETTINTCKIEHVVKDIAT